MNDLFYFIIIFIGQLLVTLKTNGQLSVIDEVINYELYFGTESEFNKTIKDCVWRYYKRDHNLCSTDVKLTFIGNNRTYTFNSKHDHWVSSTDWDPLKENHILVHGYAGGTNSLVNILKYAYKIHGGFNLFFVNFGDLSQPPCYLSLINNIPYVTQCLADYLNLINGQGFSKPVKQTCVGHSLGGVICGQLYKYLNFQLDQVIGLDPAMPLVSGINRLSRKAAKYVQVIFSNSGYYGDIGNMGHVNICINGGHFQPYCAKSNNKNLCSHVSTLCYMSQSLFDSQMYADNCHVICPSSLPIFGLIPGKNVKASHKKIPLGTHASPMSIGTYCYDNSIPPFCPKNNKNKIGLNICCDLAGYTKPTYVDEKYEV